MTIGKLMFAVRAKPGLSRAEALAHLRDRHAPLVAASTTNRRRLRTYVQNTAIDVPGIPALTATRDWIIESWRDMSVRLPEPPVAPDAIALREDEARFPDRATLLALQVEEAPVWQAHPDAPFAAAPVKLFTYVRRAAGLDAATFAGRWAAAAAALAAVPSFRARAVGFVRNCAIAGEGKSDDPTAGPSAPLVPAYDAVDIWRFADAGDLAAIFADDAFRAALVRYEAALFDQASLFRFAANERVVFDDARIDPANR